MPQSSLMFRSTAHQGRPEIPRNAPIETAAWRLGVLTDNDGHVHLGAIVAGHPGEPSTYVDLLAAVGATPELELNLARVLYLDRTDHISEFRQIAVRSIDNNRLRNQLIELADLSENHR